MGWGTGSWGALAGGAGGGSGDTTPPSISNMTPAPGELATNQTPIQFDVTDVTPGVTDVILYIKFANQRRPWVVWDGGFWDPFDRGSTRAAITNGYRYTLVPNSIWPDSEFDLTVHASDGDGNLEG